MLSHSFWGSGAQTGHRSGGLSLPQDIQVPLGDSRLGSYSHLNTSLRRENILPSWPPTNAGKQVLANWFLSTQGPLYQAGGWIVLRTTRLASLRAILKEKAQQKLSFSPLHLEVTQQDFPYILPVRGESLILAHVQAEGIWLHLFQGKSVKELEDMF